MAAERSCDRCGVAVSRDAQFCERCGQPLGKERANPLAATVPAMVRPVVEMPPRPDTGAHAHAPHEVLPPRRRGSARRLLAWVPLITVIAIVTVALTAWYGFPLETRQLLAARGLRTGVDKSRVAGFPGSGGGETPRFGRRLVAADRAPASDGLATPAYAIEEHTPSHGPYEIALPLLHPKSEGHVVVGRREGDGWTPLPTERVDDTVIAVSDTLGTFAGWYTTGEGTPSSSARVRRPRVAFGRVSVSRIDFHVDLRGLGAAHDAENPWREPVPVRALRVEVARPRDGATEPSASDFAPYPIAGGTLEWTPTDTLAVLPIAQAPLSGYGDDATVRTRWWLMRVVPVFEGGAIGAPSDPVELYPDVLRAYGHLAGTIPWPPAERRGFAANVERHPLTVLFAGYREGYEDALPWSRARVWGRLRSELSGPHVGLESTAAYDAIVTHAFGHYAVHMALGDTAASEPCVRALQQPSTRAQAFREDLATVLAQWGSGDGVPRTLGPMGAEPLAYARDPSVPSARWPADRDVDALAVEGVPATVMARLAHELGATGVLAALVSSRPSELMGLLSALMPVHREALQRVTIEEGVSWRVRGQVVDESATPVAGAHVEVRSIPAGGRGGLALSAPSADAVQAVTDANGHFIVRVPPGDVHLIATLDERRSPPSPFTAATDRPTNDPPQSLPSAIALPR